MVTIVFKQNPICRPGNDSFRTHGDDCFQTESYTSHVRRCSNDCFQTESYT